jgi:murein DD-endopeptidase MepM/ murein hydrolase activator NlpD
MKITTRIYQCLCVTIGILLLLGFAIHSTITAREANKTYQSQEFDFQFEVPTELVVKEWLPDEKLPLTLSLIPVDQTSDNHFEGIDIAVYTKSSELDINAWLTQQFIFKEAEGVRFNKVRDLKHKSNVISFSHTEYGYDINRLFIPMDDQYVFSISYLQINQKALNNILKQILKSFKIGEALYPGKSIDLEHIFIDYPYQNQNDTVNSLATSTHSVRLTTESISSYNLPWKKDISRTVTQTWSGFSHGCPGIPCYAYDFGLAEGEDVLASESGTVKLVKGDSTICGNADRANDANYVVINHGDSKATLYLHLKSTDVKAGDTVAKGQKIGLSGKTGWTATASECAAHLHFQYQDQSNSNWYNQTHAIYFIEYPDIQLAFNKSYTSKNIQVSTECGGYDVVLINEFTSGLDILICSAEHILSISNSQVQNLDMIDVHAGEKVILQNGFSVTELSGNGQFRAY